MKSIVMGGIVALSLGLSGCVVTETAEPSAAELANTTVPEASPDEGVLEIVHPVISVALGCGMETSISGHGSFHEE